MHNSTYNNSMGRYILISDDMRIRPQVISVNDYILRHHGRKEPYQLTTSAFVYKMYKDNVLTNREDMIEIMKAAFKENVRVFLLVNMTFSKDMSLLSVKI